MNESEVVIGIDLGTTTSCGAIFRNGQLENISRSATRNTIDSIVKVTRDGYAVLTLNSASRTAQLQRGGCIYETKRLIGRKYEDVKEEVEKNKWPFEVVEGENGYAAIKVHVEKDIYQTFAPEEIASFILSNIKKSAEAYLGETINSCVIGCPVDFTQDQRNATISAGILAGFDKDHISLIKESTAAAIAYANKFDAKTEGRRVYVVYDFGGGTFDASVVERIGTSYRTLSTAGDHNSGGKDIDIALMDHITKRLQEEGKVVDARKVAKLKFGCKQAKEELLVEKSISLVCDFVADCDEDEEPEIQITQAALNAVAKPIIKKTIEVVKEAMTKCSPPVKANEVDFVFLAGGSSKLSVVKEELKKMFGENKIRVDSYNLCECAIAYGATLVGYNKKLSGNTGGFIDEAENDLMSMTDIVPFSVWISSESGDHLLIPENSPTNKTHSAVVFPTARNVPAIITFFTCKENDTEHRHVVGSLSVPVNAALETVCQPLQVEARMTNGEWMRVRVIKELEHEEYCADVNVIMNKEEELSAVERSIMLSRDNQEQEMVKEMKTAIYCICDTVLYKPGVSKSLYSDVCNVVKECEKSSSVEQLLELKKRAEELCGVNS